MLIGNKRLAAFVLCVAVWQGACESTTTSPSRVASVVVSPSTPETVVGQSVQLRATLADQEGNVLNGRSVTWSTSAPSVASVNGDGLVQGLAQGTATVTAASDGTSGTAHLTVRSRAQIVLDREAVTFEAMRGGGDPPDERVTITNGGESPLVGLATAVTYVDGPSGWLSVRLASTEAPSDVVLSASPFDLESGTHTARVDVTAPGASNSPASIQVTFTVLEPPPAIGLSTDRVELEGPEMSLTPVPAFVAVSNTGGSVLDGLAVTLDYDAGQPDGWLAVSLAGVTAPTEIELAATPGTLAPGVYTATVYASAPAATNSPQSARVVFTVFPRNSVAAGPPEPGEEGAPTR